MKTIKNLLKYYNTYKHKKEYKKNQKKFQKEGFLIGVWGKTSILLEELYKDIEKHCNDKEEYNIILFVRHHKEVERIKFEINFYLKNGFLSNSGKIFEENERGFEYKKVIIFITTPESGNRRKIRFDKCYFDYVMEVRHFDKLSKNFPYIDLFSHLNVDFISMQELN